MSLSRKDAKRVTDLLACGGMPEQFFESLFEKIASRHFSVMDMIRRDPTVADDNTPLQERRRLCVKFLHSLIVSNPSRGINKINSIHELSGSDIDAMFPDNFAKYTCLVVVGCIDSEDIDTIAYVRSTDCLNGHAKPLSSSEIERLRSDLESLGYDTKNRKIDVNTVYVDPVSQNIIASFKGGPETQNIINHTHRHHRQIMSSVDPSIPLALEQHPVRDIVFTRDVVFLKIRAFAKYLLDYAEDISIDYKEFRGLKKEAYRMSTDSKTTDSAFGSDSAFGGDYLMRFVKNAMNYIQLDVSAVQGIEQKKKWHDRFKSLTMKLIDHCS